MPRKKKIEEANGVLKEDMQIADGSSKNQPNLVQEINQMRSEGKVGSPEFVSKMRQLEVILGVSQISPFGTNELEIFEENLKDMSLSDLQKLANKIGINPFQPHPVLKKNLIREFQAYTRNSRRNIMPTSVNSFVPDPNNPAHKELLKILSDI
jgi:hypothetical protein